MQQGREVMEQQGEEGEGHASAHYCIITVICRLIHLVEEWIESMRGRDDVVMMIMSPQQGMVEELAIKVSCIHRGNIINQ